jgi:hypothetical protein
MRIFPTVDRGSRGRLRAIAWALAALVVALVISSGRAAERKDKDWALHAPTQQAKEVPAKEIALIERTFACRPLAGLIQFFTVFSVGDKEDAGRLLDAKLHRGDCIAFEAGDKVNLTKQENNGLFMCLRRVGSDSNLCFWTLSTWVPEAQL